MCKEVVQCLGVGLCYACSPRGVKSNTSAHIITRGGAMYRVRDCAAGKEPASACASRTHNADTRAFESYLLATVPGSLSPSPEHTTIPFCAAWQHMKSPAPHRIVSLIIPKTIIFTV